MRLVKSVLALAAAFPLALSSPADAQRFPGLGSIEGRVGVIDPESASRGFAAGANLGLGYLGTPSLRTIAGITYWNADADRAGVEGSFTAIGGQVGLRLDVLPTTAISPYLFGAVLGQNVDASLNEEQVERDLSGFNVGAGVGGGVSYALDAAQRTRVTAEYKQTFINNFNSWGIAVGFRLVPRGRNAYLPIARYRDPYWGAEAARATTEAERARLERERLEAERRRVEQERLRDQDTQLRAEQERLRAQETERRAEQERLARMTEEERRRAQQEAEAVRRRAEQEAEAVRQRAQQETAEARRQAEREAAARAAAEAEAARARQEAEAARAEAEAAQRQAREAEARLYQSLLDLDRLIANITEIRETERGLSIVLGQGLFAVGQSSLSARARDEVGRIAAVLAQYPEHQISVEGHTDSTGSAEANQRLSEQRAASVRAALVANGIDPNRVDTLGHGQDLPIADNATTAGRAQNRRVEIVLLGAQRPAP